MESPRGLGSIKSPDDYRDGIASALAIPSVRLPLSYKTDLSQIGVLDQNLIPACVSHAWVQVMRYWWFLKTGEVVNFSPRFLDILSWESDIPLDGGRRPRTVAKISMDVGCCTTNLLPNNTDLPLAQYRNKSIITQAMRDEAAKYKIPGYIEIDLDSTSIRTAILKYGVVSILLNIGSEWWLPSWNKKDILPLRPPQRVVGGHQTVRSGWDQSFALGLNEWSVEWADNGNYIYNEEAYQPYTREVLTIAELEEEVLMHLKALPPPNTFKYTFNQNLQLGDGRLTPSEEVKKLQTALATLGYFKYPDITGFYGPITRNAVYQFQLDHVKLGFMSRYFYRGKYFYDESRLALNQLIN